MAFLQDVCEILAVSMYVGSFMALLAAILVAGLAACLGVYLLPTVCITGWIILISVPLGSPAWGKKLSKFAMTAYEKRNNFKVVYEDPFVFTPDKHFVVGYEPHSVLPVGLPQELHSKRGLRWRGRGTLWPVLFHLLCIQISSMSTTTWGTSPVREAHGRDQRALMPRGAFHMGKHLLKAPCERKLLWQLYSVAS